MKINFCTLFDYNYIEKGLALYNSLNHVCKDFMLYVIAFDDQCFESLLDLKLNNLTVISYHAFETKELRLAKQNRSTREFLWTCSSHCVLHCIKGYGLSNCTYLDSDLFFFTDPSCIIETFIKSDNDVGIISHRYSNHYINKIYKHRCGEYCVEFITFKNTDNGINVLDWWCKKCIESCPEKPRKEAFGDQKYLSFFSSYFSRIYVYEEFGLGLAPWNIDDYSLISDNKIKHRKSGESGDIVFYHFHSMSIYDSKANIDVYKRPGKKDDRLIKMLYGSYLGEIRNGLSSVNKEFPPILTSDNSSLLSRTMRYIFAEKNIIIAIQKLVLLVFNRNKDIFDY